MWYLVCPNKDGRSYRLTPDKDQHQVGRTIGDILLNGDQSVSRKHAVFTFETDNNGKKIVTIKDLASKYGTYVNGTFKLEPNKPRTLEDGDVITFGCQWNDWRYHSKQIVVTSSNMPNEAKGKLRNIILELGGIVVGDWQESCSHLTMAEILLTAKVVCALASGIPIVTPNYWERFKEAIEEKKIPPNYEHFIPPLKESILNRNKVSFAINDERRKLFSGKTFVFSSEKQLKKYKTIVVAGGGSCQTLSNCEMTLDDLCGSDVVVMQHVFNTDTQPPPLYDDVIKEMRGRGLKPIPESEIGLAVLMCSLDTYCNMKYNVIGNVLEGGVVMSQVKRAEVLAEDSQMSVLDYTSVKMEKPAIKTEEEADTRETTPALSIMAGSSLSSDTSSRRGQNNQETLPCGAGETYTQTGNTMDGNASPCEAPGPSRKRPPSIEIGEPPPKKCPPEKNFEGVKEKYPGQIKDFRLGNNPPNQKKPCNTINDRGDNSISATSKRKLNETDGDFLNGGPRRKSGKTEPTSSLFPDFGEDLLASESALMSMLDPESDLRGESNGTTSKRKMDETDGSVLNRGPPRKSGKAKPFSTLFPAFGGGPSTSGGGPVSALDLEEEDKNWQKEAERAVKATVESDWGSKWKENDAKRPGRLKDFGIGMTVKMANLVVNDKPKKKVVEPAAFDPSVVNYKKFRKVKAVGGGVSLPVIIGESDLVPFKGGDNIF